VTVNSLIFFFQEFIINETLLGVDDGQFGKVIAHEIPAIREAFNRKYLSSIYTIVLNLNFSYLW